MLRSFSKRLQAIAELVPAGDRVADIGCDHAQLLIHLARTQRLKSGIGGDVRPGPLGQAQRNLQSYPVPLPIVLRLGDGLEVLQKEEPVDSIVIAGLGGKRIVALLENGRDILQHVRTLVLQPNHDGSVVRRWLIDNQWCLMQEDLIEERGYLYEIMVAQPGNGEIPYFPCVVARSLLQTLGPILWRKNHPLLWQRWQQEWDRCEQVLVSLQNRTLPYESMQHWWYWRDILLEGKKILNPYFGYRECLSVVGKE